MRCRRCQSTIVESHVEKTHASAQTWVRCSLCGSTSIFTTPATANDRGTESGTDAIDRPDIINDVSGHDASGDNAFEVMPTSSSALRF